MEADTTAPSYWLNWRFLLCAIWIIVAMLFSALVIWRFEGHKKSKNEMSRHLEEPAGLLYEDEAWETCSKSIHPIWLLAYRVVAFCALLALLLSNVIVHTFRVYYNYTQWTFTLVTIYFGLGSLLSIYGRLLYHNNVDSERNPHIRTDSERGSYVAPTLGEDADIPDGTSSLSLYGEDNRKTASVYGYMLQIIFQICSGAVVLTDTVFWLIIYPFLTPKDYRVTFLLVCMHSANAVVLGDAIFNSLRFPFFRIAYFMLWTCTFVIFQWIIHACVWIRWPYTFLDLSSPYAPLWYLAVGLMQIPCFSVIALIYRIKGCFTSR